ncbi:MAG TPA: hypothetical protein VF395_17285 [Polyangiaceae bacterium]
MAPPHYRGAAKIPALVCKYTNDSATPLMFGESAITDEMCILGGIYYPVMNVTSPNLLCF